MARAREPVLNARCDTVNLSSRTCKMGSGRVEWESSTCAVADTALIHESHIAHFQIIRYEK
jgi:hypothetical protein